MGHPRVAGGVELRRRRRWWNRRVTVRVVAVVVACGLVAGAFAFWATRGNRRVTPSGCRVAVGTSRYSVDLSQAANATTIAVVGKRLSLPDHAVTIALATALQESQLHNLSYGDRDSVGLFQQRPSQGWGSAAQIMRPDYAAAAFFKALGRVHGWQTMSVTDAAQAVQRSDAPDAYATWEPLARTLAIAATGERPGALACEFSLRPAPVRPASPAAALARELGGPALATPVAPTRGWTIAAWLVGHAEQYRITSVQFHRQEWTPDGVWRPVRRTAPGVRITQAPARP
jgi:hypothetical protein